eukprot:m.32650 g.32650  ORF g.32650 m.32650 type:complete len:694 (+) comp8434_c0_seq2:101-2182(+)
MDHQDAASDPAKLFANAGIKPDKEPKDTTVNVEDKDDLKVVKEYGWGFCWWVALFFSVAAIITVVLVLTLVVFVAGHCGVPSWQDETTFFNFYASSECCDEILNNLDSETVFKFNNQGANTLFDWMNNVDGINGDPGPRWKAPIQGEEIHVVQYKEVVQTAPKFLAPYYTGSKTPSWEEDDGHDTAGELINRESPIPDCVYSGFVQKTTPIYTLDHNKLMDATWDGFDRMDYHEIKFASNGDFGYTLVEKRQNDFNTLDTLGILMTETTLGMNLEYNNVTDKFILNLEKLKAYSSIAGYAPLGGKATFRFDATQDGQVYKGRLVTETIEYDGKTYTVSDSDQTVIDGLASGKWRGWKFAEKAIFASLLSQINLITHVKLIHLELAAAFQAVTVNAFTQATTHPLRRLLDQFTHRSIQATNANFDLLYHHKAATFTLAPLNTTEQLKLMEDFMRDEPTYLHELDMSNYAAVRNMQTFSSPAPLDNTTGNPSRLFWRWHHRSSQMQQLFSNLIDCWLEQNYGADYKTDAALYEDETLKAWWQSMRDHLPSIQRTLEKNPGYLTNGELTYTSLSRVLSIIMLWVSWIHEDVGHAASYFVYNPIHTPMCVEQNGDGVPLNSFGFNVFGYRNFVFLERAKFLDSPPNFWFSETANDKQCYTTFQNALKALGDNDEAFANCGQQGFYSCVADVETAVSS